MTGSHPAGRYLVNCRKYFGGFGVAICVITQPMKMINEGVYLVAEGKPAHCKQGHRNTRGFGTHLTVVTVSVALNIELVFRIGFGCHEEPAIAELEEVPVPTAIGAAELAHDVKNGILGDQHVLAEVRRQAIDPGLLGYEAGGQGGVGGDSHHVFSLVAVCAISLYTQRTYMQSFFGNYL